jgi:hypothetical protein
MHRVGSRIQLQPSLTPRTEGLRHCCELSTLAAQMGARGFPKGVYAYRTLGEADRHREEVQAANTLEAAGRAQR